MIKKQKYTVDFVTGICVPVVEMNLTSVQVQGDIRPLQVTWTPELAQDLEAYHNIDAEQELTNLLSEHVASEIDREILNDLIELSNPPDPIRPHHNMLTINEVDERVRDMERQRQIREETVRKWEGLGFLEGLDGHVRENITHLYEAQARTLINETPDHGFDRIQFPEIRRVTPTLVANEIIEPLNAPPPFPEGRLFYFTPTLREEQEEYDVNWITEDTWSYENLYGSIIGISMELQPHEFIPKEKSSFDVVTFPTVNRVFS